MAVYVALLRGIGPANPNTRNDKIAAVLASLGCKDVHAILASGNFVFSSSARSSDQLEARIEGALHQQLGLSCDTIVRRHNEIDALMKADPFNGAEHGKEWYLTVTFLKDRRPPVYSKLDRTKMDGPEFMADLEKRHGKRITTRTWNTLRRIVDAGGKL